MKTLVYEDTDFFKFLPEMQKLYPLHYDELSVTKEVPLEPDYDAYRRMADAGMLRCIICRVDEEVIGYIIFIIQPHLHYKSCMSAFEDVYFIKKEYRKGRVGIKLFQYAEKVLKHIGVKRVSMHTKVHADNSRLFEYLNYKWTDKTFTKML
jgi:predicted acetyltransferase